jgi:hypothetical protein
MLKQKKDTLDFFREMENNIKERNRKAQEMEEKYPGDSQDIMYELSTSPSELQYYREDSKDAGSSGRERFNSAASGEGKLSSSFEGRGRAISFAPPRRIRTISTMDGTRKPFSNFEKNNFSYFSCSSFLHNNLDEVLMLMRQSSGEERRTSGYSRRISPLVAEEKTSSGNYSSKAQAKESLLAQSRAAEAKVPSSYDTNDFKSAPASMKKKKQLKRRNSTGTIYIENTMATQDNTATIECVCVVIRAHMITAARENIVPLAEYDVFKDIGFGNTNRGAEQKDPNNPLALVSFRLFL